MLQSRITFDMLLMKEGKAIQLKFLEAILVFTKQFSQLVGNSFSLLAEDILSKTGLKESVQPIPLVIRRERTDRRKHG